MVKVSVVALTAAVLAALLRKYTPEMAVLLALCAGIWILSVAVGGLGAVVALLEELTQLAGVSDELLEPVVKTVILSILTKLTAEICRSAGESGIAAFTELAGTVMALVVTLPLVRAVMTLMAEILG